MTRAPTFPVQSVDWDDIVRDAVRSAQAAASVSGVEIREIDQPLELEAISRLLSIVWNREATNRQMTAELLRALAMTGNYVAGAFIDGRLAGASVAFFSAPPQTSIHSHITGVVNGSAARSVGYAIKLHQRAWALHRGVSTITWTFDPLVRRNAYFNIAKLGVTAVRYLPNFYGEMHDPINAGDETDRLLVEWELSAPRVVAALDAGRPAADIDGDPPIDTVLRVDHDGRPERSAWEADRAVLAVPADVEAMRARSPALAQAWRLALRQALGAAMADGGRVIGFRRSEGYIVEGGRGHV